MSLRRYLRILEAGFCESEETLNTRDQGRKDVAERAGGWVQQDYNLSEAILLVAGEHILGDLEPQCV